jgi:hypothetical protein
VAFVTIARLLPGGRGRDRGADSTHRAKSVLALAATLKHTGIAESPAGKTQVPQKETLSTRVTRLEELHRDLAERTKILLDAQIRTDEILRESGEKADERIGKLVSAIGELISRIPPLR